MSLSLITESSTGSSIPIFTETITCAQSGSVIPGLTGAKNYIQLSPTVTPQTITAAQCPCIVLIPEVTAAVTVTLPSPALGLSITLLVTHASDGSHSCIFNNSSGTANVLGNLLSSPSTIATFAPVSASTHMTLSATAADVVAGDKIEMIGTASQWLITATSASQTAAGWSFS